ncbi:hypothetical protein GUITHDRAFT_118858 [Guillardia theta CCMP2712]|uniref:Uncharacterized protein n=1 Tax=Guillardia theta (strain CCMP2712) TaxID=905079 RepID=L1IFB7_GUITC|nr:hypothetical protein GUITHDRAFT_118858 [Guillardia theta CCMP2712]EKX34923.1 hypothetical protein GUITHDRAFT_118858 [Guillardia theta CCMP2712]|eukprot:XP_005821903.1 hypothetical protein GUITHDRAFT_118858 [Guillardia theta CCMP2712]
MSMGWTLCAVLGCMRVRRKKNKERKKKMAWLHEDLNDPEHQGPGKLADVLRSRLGDEKKRQAEALDGKGSSERKVGQDLAHSKRKNGMHLSNGKPAEGKWKSMEKRRQMRLKKQQKLWEQREKMHWIATEREHNAKLSAALDSRTKHHVDINPGAAAPDEDLKDGNYKFGPHWSIGGSQPEMVSAADPKEEASLHFEDKLTDSDSGGDAQNVEKSNSL